MKQSAYTAPGIAFERKPELLEIQDFIKTFTGVDITEPGKTYDHVEARHLYFWLAKKYTKWPYRTIGQLAGKNHSTVTHGIQKIAQEYEIYSDRRNDIIAVEKYFLQSLKSNPENKVA